MSFREYYRLICRVGPEINAFAHIGAPQYSEADVKVFSDTDLLRNPKFPADEQYRYMAYLRHHGFPSPLLDWTRSPFVAAFFAFRQPNDPRDDAATRSIFAYCESPDGIKSGTVGDRTIRHLGRYVQTHHRHFRQQCEYTICARFDDDLKEWVYDSHQEEFDHGRFKEQDSLWKFELPSTEREKVLRRLNDYNLNAFSLFASDEGLLETMWNQEHVFRAEEEDTHIRSVADSPLRTAKQPPFGKPT